MYSGFSEAYLEKVLHEESETEGWTLTRRSREAEVRKKKYPNESIHAVKAFLRLPGIPPDDTVRMLQDLELRKKWDTQFSAIDVLQDYPTHRVICWLAPFPLRMQTRDIVQYVAEKRDELTNTTYILYSNVPEDLVPPKPGIVRAVTIQSAVIVRPDSQDPTSTRMTLIFQTDFRGRLPKFLVNAFSVLAPIKWRNDLYNFYINVYSKEKETVSHTALQRRERDSTEANTTTNETSVCITSTGSSQKSRDPGVIFPPKSMFL